MIAQKTSPVQWLIILFVLMTSTGYAQKLSDKIDPAKQYPHEWYIAATSSGDTEDIAKSKAIAGIAQVIKVDLNSQQKLVQEYHETGTGSDMNLQMQSTFSRDIELVTEQTLKNVFIGKTWFSDNDGLYYAFAYMNRSETSDILIVDLEKIDAEISIYFAKFEKELDKMSKLAYLSKALNLAIKRDLISEQLSTISLGAKSFTPSVKPAELAAARHDFTKKFKIKLELHYKDWDEFKSAVTEVLGSFGFQIVETEPDVLVTGKLAMERLERKQKCVRWYVELHFVDASSLSEFFTYSDDDRECRKSYSEAERLAATRLSAEIRKKLYRQFDDYLNSLMTVK